MSRQIKLRAWNTHAQTWVEGLDYVLHTSGRLINVPEHIVLSEWTGFVDKNGREIWEGDIVLWRREKYPILFAEGSWILQGTETLYEEDGPVTLGNVHAWAEVIGTIYENGDVLEVQRGQ